MSRTTPENFFSRFETFNRQERERAATALVLIYKDALQDERERFAEYIKDKGNKKHELEYFEAVQRLGGITDVFSELGIDYENIEIETAPK